MWSILERYNNPPSHAYWSGQAQYQEVSPEFYMYQDRVSLRKRPKGWYVRSCLLPASYGFVGKAGQYPPPFQPPFLLSPVPHTYIYTYIYFTVSGLRNLQGRRSKKSLVTLRYYIDKVTPGKSINRARIQPARWISSHALYFWLLYRRADTPSFGLPGLLCPRAVT